MLLPLTPKLLLIVGAELLPSSEEPLGVKRLRLAGGLNLEAPVSTDTSTEISCGAEICDLGTVDTVGTKLNDTFDSKEPLVGQDESVADMLHEPDHNRGSDDQPGNNEDDEHLPGYGQAW